MKTTDQPTLHETRIQNCSSKGETALVAPDLASTAPQRIEPAPVLSQVVHRVESPLEIRVQVSDSRPRALDIVEGAGDEAEGLVDLKSQGPAIDLLTYYTVFGVYEGCADR